MSKIIDMKFSFVRIFLLLAISISMTSLNAESITIKDAPGILPALLDIPSDWERSQSVKANGIILTLKKGSALMELRSFVSPQISMDYIINARAARLYANNSYLKLVIDKSEKSGDTRRRTLIWQMNRQSETWYEKTMIIYFENNIMILSCTAPEAEYRNHRVIFENAFLSLRFDVQARPEPVKPKENEVQNNETGQLIRDLEETHDHSIDKSEKLKNEDENP